MRYIAIVTTECLLAYFTLSYVYTTVVVPAFTDVALTLNSIPTGG